MHKLPAPSFILWAQLFGTAVAVKMAHMGGLISHLDALEYDKLRAFFPVALIFCATIFTNIKSLEYANVETFMIFRFSTPLCISIADYVFLGRHLPSARASSCCCWGLGYALTDAAYVVRGYMFYNDTWYFIFCGPDLSEACDQYGEDESTGVECSELIASLHCSSWRWENRRYTERIHRRSWWSWSPWSWARPCPTPGWRLTRVGGAV